MSIEQTILLIEKLFVTGVTKINDCAFDVIIDGIKIYFCYNEGKGLIGKVKPPCYIICCKHDKTNNTACLIETTKFTVCADTHHYLDTRHYLEQIFNKMTLENNTITVGAKAIHISNMNFAKYEGKKLEPNIIFSQKNVFDSNYTYANILNPVPIVHLNGILEQQWNIVKGIIVKKYLILIEFCGYRDVAGMIMSFLYSLGF